MLSARTHSHTNMCLRTTLSIVPADVYDSGESVTTIYTTECAQLTCARVWILIRNCRKSCVWGRNNSFLYSATACALALPAVTDIPSKRFSASLDTPATADDILTAVVWYNAPLSLCRSVRYRPLRLSLWCSCSHSHDSYGIAIECLCYGALRSYLPLTCLACFYL